MALRVYMAIAGGEDPAMERPVQIKITRQTVARVIGEPAPRTVRPPEVVLVSAGDGRLLIGGKKAEFFRDAAPGSSASTSRPSGRKATR
jgi:hypothetical protein